MWQLPRTSQFCYALLAVALVVFSPGRLVADAAAEQSAGSFAAPAAFQSPVSDVRSTTNTAAAIDSGPAVARSPTAKANTASESPAPTNAKPQLPIARDGRSAPRLPQSVSKESNGSITPGSQSLVTILGGLGVVLGLFFVTVWLFRGNTSKGTHTLPSEVLEPLGRTAVVKGKQLQLLRFGSKLVLVSVSPNGIDAISEITDPVEVDRIAGLCLRSGHLSSTQAFRNVLDSFAGRSDGERSSTSSRRAPEQARSWGRARGRSREDDDV